LESTRLRSEKTLRELELVFDFALHVGGDGKLGRSIRVGLSRIFAELELSIEDARYMQATVQSLTAKSESNETGH
jgi:hypothetical protein